MAERAKALIDAFGRKGLRYHLQSSGAYFAYVRHPFPGTPAKAVAMRLAADHDVLCLPGSMFGPDQEDYLRFAFANAEASKMESLVDRLMESQG
jgi:aspartate/methionine/tyrosine aminotransferase